MSGVIRHLGCDNSATGSFANYVIDQVAAAVWQATMAAAVMTAAMIAMAAAAMAAVSAIVAAAMTAIQ